MNEGSTNPMTNTAQPDPVYRVADVAEHLNVEQATVYALVASGRLRAVHVGRLIRIPASALNDFLAGR